MILYDSVNKDSPLSTQYQNEIEQCLKYFERWPEQEQVQFVKSLLSQMNHQQLQQINSYLTPMLQRDFISLLTRMGIYYVAEKIFSYLDIHSLHKSELVCKEWRRVIQDGPLWRNLTYRKVVNDAVWRNVAVRRGWMKCLSERKHVRRDSDYFSFTTLNRVKHDMERIDERWTNGQFRLHKIVYESSLPGVYCLQYDVNKLVSGHRDNTIKIWDINSLQCTKVLCGHTGSVLCLQCDANIIISGSSDRSITVWDVNTGRILNVLNHHEDSVLHLRFLNNILVTSSKDRSIAVWDLISPTCITLRRVLLRHRGAVNVVEMDEQHIVSASGDRTIRLWSTSSGEHMRTFRGHERGITSLHYQDNLIVSGSSDNTIRMWSMSGMCLRVFQGHQSLVRSLKFNKKYMVSGDYNGKIKVWDFVSALNLEIPSAELCLQTFHQHGDSVFAIQFDKYQMISSSRDNVILVWDFLNCDGATDYVRSDL